MEAGRASSEDERLREHMASAEIVFGLVYAEKSARLMDFARTITPDSDYNVHHVGQKRGMFLKSTMSKMAC